MKAYLAPPAPGVQAPSTDFARAHAFFVSDRLPFKALHGAHPLLQVSVLAAGKRRLYLVDPFGGPLPLQHAASPPSSLYCTSPLPAGSKLSRCVCPIVPAGPLVAKRNNAARWYVFLCEDLSMKAIARTRYGPPDVLQYAEVEQPIPRDNEVLVKLCAASVNPVDLFQMRGAPLIRLLPGLRKPKNQVLGCDIAGRVQAVGGLVKQFQPGDDVFGAKGLAGGGFAEYVCTVEDHLARKPANSSFDAAEALRYLEQRHAQGKIVLTVD